MRGLFVLSALLGTSFQAWPQECQVTVYTRIGLMLPPGMFLDARMKTTAMFRDIGIGLRIVDGIPNRALAAHRHAGAPGTRFAERL